MEGISQSPKRHAKRRGKRLEKGTPYKNHKIIYIGDGYVIVKHATKKRPLARIVAERKSDDKAPSTIEPVSSGS